MVMLARPRDGKQPPRRKRPPRCVRVPGFCCPLHGGPVYLTGKLLFCPGCLRYVPTTRK